MFSEHSKPARAGVLGFPARDKL